LLGEKKAKEVECLPGGSMAEKLWDFRVAQPSDFPNWLMFTSKSEDDPRVVVRQEDGSWWKVSAGKVGYQIVDEPSLRLFDSWYEEVELHQKRNVN
jgi:hypothetical protein